MEFSEVVHRRQMTRRFDPDRPVPTPVIEAALRHAVRAPSAGFSQGWDFVVLECAEERAAFWEATTNPHQPPDAWLRGVRNAPVLILCCSDPEAYLDRYAEPDKGWSERSRERFSAPYWDIDTGMAALMMLLSAADQKVGALFFGVPVSKQDAVRTALQIPAQRHLVGVVALGYPVIDAPRSRRRSRRPLSEVTHRGTFGVPYLAEDLGPERSPGSRPKEGTR